MPEPRSSLVSSTGRTRRPPRRRAPPPRRSRAAARGAAAAAAGRAARAARRSRGRRAVRLRAWQWGQARAGPSTAGSSGVDRRRAAGLGLQQLGRAPAAAVQLEDERAEVQQQGLARPSRAPGAALRVVAWRVGHRDSTAAARGGTIRAGPDRLPRAARRGGLHRKLGEDPLARAARRASGPSSSARLTPSATPPGPASRSARRRRPPPRASRSRPSPRARSRPASPRPRPARSPRAATPARTPTRAGRGRCSSSSDTQPVNSTLSPASARSSSIASSCQLAHEHEAHVRQLAPRPPRTAGGPSARACERTRCADGQRQRLRGPAGSAPNGSGTPWWITVTRSGGIGVFRSISAAAVVGVRDQPGGAPHDPAAGPAPQAALLVAVADVRHVGRVEAADDHHRRLAQQPGERDREEGVPGGEPAEHEVGPQHPAHHRGRAAARGPAGRGPRSRSARPGSPRSIATKLALRLWT